MKNVTDGQGIIGAVNLVYSEFKAMNNSRHLMAFVFKMNSIFVYCKKNFILKKRF